MSYCILCIVKAINARTFITSTGDDHKKPQFMRNFIISSEIWWFQQHVFSSLTLAVRLIKILSKSKLLIFSFNCSVVDSFFSSFSIRPIDFVHSFIFNIVLSEQERRQTKTRRLESFCEQLFTRAAIMT